ncbi:MAG: hypothetical protein QXN37_00330 [Candidatus Anstonellaceae archaeon]
MEADLKEAEQTLRKIADETDAKLLEQNEGRPYLLVIIGLHEIGREGNKSKIAAQWEWRSNIQSNYANMSNEEAEVAKRLVSYLVDQLSDVANHPEFGIKKKYGLI